MRQKVNSVVDANTPNVRVVVLGGRSVGKSALIVRFLTKRFIGEYVSGTEITYLQKVTLAGNNVMAEICDALIKKEPHDYLRKLATRTDAYLVVYNVCNRASFEYACHLVQIVRGNHRNLNRDIDLPIILLGNKSDLDHFREVKLSEGENFAKTIPRCCFLETSAAESYLEVEKAFQLVFQLVLKRLQPSPPPSAPAYRPVRKNSISQMAHMIRDHVRKQHSTSGNHKAHSLERGMSLSRSNSVSFDNNNNATISDHSWKRRTRKHGIGMLQPNSSTNNPKPKLLSKCLSLSTLSEHPGNTPLKNVTNANGSATESIPRHQRYHTIDGNLSSRSPSNVWKRKEATSSSPGAMMKMSLSSDDTLDLSDMSTPEEDAFLSDGSKTSPVKSNTDPDLAKQLDEAKKLSTTLMDRPESAHRTQKNPINKKNLQIIVHSDGELEDKDLGEFNEIPPKSAPIVHSTSGNKFRYFPNMGLIENQESLKQPWTALSNTSVPLSPLLTHGKRGARIKSPKEEKRSPSHNLLKQFFKGALNGSSSTKGLSGSSLSLPSQVSPASSESSLITVSEHPRNILESIDEQQTCARGDGHTENGVIYFHASSASLSSINSNDNSVLDPFTSTSSAPCSPRVKKASNHPNIKTRRSSFRETVGDLMRKRKKSNASDSFKHSQECFL